MSRANKLRALSRDPGATEGERLAAAEALERHERANPPPPPPERHSKEWIAQVGKFRRHVGDLHSRIGGLMSLGNPPLSWPEYRMLKNMAHNGADLFNARDTEFIEMVERKLAGRAEQNETIALAYEPGITLDRGNR
jgi:hypothetical protein